MDRYPYEQICPVCGWPMVLAALLNDRDYCAIYFNRWKGLPEPKPGLKHWIRRRRNERTQKH